MNELSEHSRAIIEAARRDGGATSAQRARVKAAVEARIVSRVPPATSASWAAGLAVVGLAIGAIGLIRSRSPSSTSRHPLVVRVDSSPPVVSPASLRVPAAPASDEATDTVPAVSTAAAPRDEHPSTRATARRLTSPSPALAASRVTPSGTLEDEVVIIAAARRELRNGSPASALEVLAGHATRFPDGVLRDERRLLRIRSLCALGRDGDAASEARALADDAPGSALVLQARGVCGTSAAVEPSHPNHP